MMKTLLSLSLFVIGVAMAQRSPYAGNRNRNNLQPMYRPDSSELGNRVNIETTELPDDLKGTLHDDQLVQRVAEWPEDKQPFWFKNRHALAANRNRPVNGNGPADPITFQDREDQDQGTQQRFGLSPYYNGPYPGYFNQPSPTTEDYNFANSASYPAWWGQQEQVPQYRPRPETTSRKPNRKYTNLNRHEVDEITSDS